MIRTTPFFARTQEANETGLWTHWSGHVVAQKYQMSEKFEYFAVRNSAGVFDSSPLYKYRIRGADAERYLSGVLARDVRTCRPGRAQYTLWCDDRGFVLEDGVIFRRSHDDFLLTTAEPNLAYFLDLVGGLAVTIEDESNDYGVLAVQGPASRTVLAALAPEVAELSFFALTDVEIAGTSVMVSRTGFTGDLGYELWVPAGAAATVWDAVLDAGAGFGVSPIGQTALLMCRIEAGLLLLDTDFESSRFAWNDAHRSTPLELGFGWMFRDLGDRPFIGRRAIAAEIEHGTSRWNMVGVVVDWKDYDVTYERAGLIAPKDHIPRGVETMLYDDERRRVGYTSSFMYSPILQNHIAIARVRPDLAAPGSRVNLEVTIDHAYEMVGASVARLPLYDPPHKTA